MLQFIDFMPIILFDGVCNFCNQTVNTILKYDKAGIYQFATIQSAAATDLIRKFRLDQKGLSTVILIDGDLVFTKSEAVSRIAANLSGWPYLFRVLKFIPKPVADFFYDAFAKYRYQLFGKQLNCMVPNKKYKNRFLV